MTQQTETDLLDNVLNTLSSAIYWKDEYGVFLGCNETFLKYIGLKSVEELTGRTNRDIEWNLNGDCLLGQKEIDYFAPIEEAVLSGKTENGSGVFQQLATKECIGGYLKADFHAIEHKNRRVIIATFCDVTAEKMAQHQMRLLELRAQTTKQELLDSLKQSEELRQKAENSSKKTGAFLANVSHEICTPMNGIIGMTDLLLCSQQSESQRSYTRAIHESANHLFSLINDLLDSAKIESGEFSIEYILFDLQKEVQSVVELLRVVAEKKGIALHFQYPSHAMTCFSGPSVRIKQVITNMLGNAIKFTDKGSVTLKMDIESDGEYTIINGEVIDTGMGIPPEKMENVFDKFSQVDNANEDVEGTGLGLTITRQLVEVMGGSIGVESTPGEGSTFSFRIPVLNCTEEEKQQLLKEEDKESEKVKTEAIVSESEGCTQSTFAIVASGSVLLVEDQHINQMLMVKILDKLGFSSVEMADNGEEALEKLRENTYDLIIMDCQMPKMDGYTATRKFREMEKGHTPVVAMTAHALEGDRAKCLEAGMDDYLTKPVNIEKVMEVLKKWVSKLEAPIEHKTFCASDSASLFDISYFDALTNGNTVQSSEVLELLRLSIEDNLAALSINLHDARAWKEICHSFKSNANNIGAASLACIAQKAENAYLENKKMKEAFLSDLKEESQKVLSFIENHFGEDDDLSNAS